MNFIDNLKEKVKKYNKTIVLPESSDIRTLKAASMIKKEDFCNIILIGNEEQIYLKAQLESVDINGIKIIDPLTYEKTDELVNNFFELRKNKGITLESAKKLITEDYLYFGNMLVKLNLADGLVAGAIHSSGDVLRPALQIIKTKKEIKTASSFFIMDTKTKYGSNGIFIYSDSGMNQNPTSEQLADIAYSSNESFKNLIEETPMVAFLSHSTYGSAKHDDVTKVTDALKITREKYPNIIADGELQFDAAIIEEIAKMKCPTSKVAGKANVLIFPDLDSGNIAYKITERLCGADAYGPLTQGLDKPINDLSRGCNEFDIVGVVAITCAQSIN